MLKLKLMLSPAMLEFGLSLSIQVSNVQCLCIVGNIKRHKIVVTRGGLDNYTSNICLPREGKRGASRYYISILHPFIQHF